MTDSLPIFTISLPTPWPAVGPVHAYLVRQDPITLIDTGMNNAESREALLVGLRAAGVGLSDIKRILLTHAHRDHCGQAGWVQEQTGAELWMHPDEAGKAEQTDWWQAGRAQALDSAGVPPEMQALMEHWWRESRRQGGALGPWRPLADGLRVVFDAFDLEAVHLPGHALGHTGFWHADSGVLIGGDHLIQGVSPNPVMEPVPAGHPAAVPHAPHRALTLDQFLRALERVAALPVRRVLPGHGPVITDHQALVRTYLARHERRLDLLCQRLGAGTTAFAVSREVYPRVTEGDLFLALSEVLAHLDLLVVRGRATVTPGAPGAGDIYRATSALYAEK
ncbi:MAG: hypothetical protein JWN15_192 [Firmicutes bacterium]|nr:hypothetical protein [Bacillota bacterium]